MTSEAGCWSSWITAHLSKIAFTTWTSNLATYLKEAMFYMNSHTSKDSSTSWGLASTGDSANGMPWVPKLDPSNNRGYFLTSAFLTCMFENSIFGEKKNLSYLREKNSFMIMKIPNATCNWAHGLTPCLHWLQDVPFILSFPIKAMAFTEVFLLWVHWQVDSKQYNDGNTA